MRTGSSITPDSNPSIGETDSIRSFVDDTLDRGRSAAGFSQVEDRRSLRQVLRDENLSIYPLLAVLALSVAGSLSGSALALVSPDISRTFGLSPQFFTAIALMSQIISLGVPLLVARFVQNRARRALVVLVTQGIWCVLTGLQGLVVTISALMILMILDTATSSAQGTVEGPLVFDLYPPVIRVRVMSILMAVGLFTGLISTGVSWILTGPLQLTWRGVYLACALVSLFGLLFALRLRDPGYGRYDTQAVRRAVRNKLHGESPGADTATAVITTEPEALEISTNKPNHRAGLTFSEALQRIWNIGSMRIMLLATLISSLQIPVSIYLSFNLANRFSLDLNDRSLLAFVSGAAGLVFYFLLAPLGDRIFRRSPKLLFYISGALGMVGVLMATMQMFVFSLTALIALTIGGAALSGLSGPALAVGSMSIVPAQLRPHVGAVTALFLLMGNAAGTALLGGLTTTMDIPTAVAITTGITLISTIMTMFVGRRITNDLDSVIEEIVEDEYVSSLAEQDGNLPVLSVRNLHFSYGQTKVLFGVDFTVEPGECVALLGVNGAGKSTLLRAVAGLDLADSGSVRLDGHDITYVDAARRARMGIVQVPGGKATFPELTVHANLQCCVFGMPRKERSEIDSRIAEALEMFPSLKRRLDVSADTLSGGEQQMLGLARAIILRPRLLMIDELSLGLAPKVVGELLDVVRRINQQGTAVVIVEQSVNIALSIATRAVFLERGRVQFDGAPDDLLSSGLLRAVFLGTGKEER